MEYYFHFTWPLLGTEFIYIAASQQYDGMARFPVLVSLRNFTGGRLFHENERPADFPVFCHAGSQESSDSERR